MKAVPPADPALLGELARRLLEDPDGKVQAEYRQQFESAALAARSKLHEPLSPQEFAVQSAVAESSQLCVEVVAAAWDSLH